MNRGANKQNVFLCEKHYQLFLDLLLEIHRKYQVEIHAYCLMGNHYHLLLRTRLPNLSRAMQHLDGVYTRRHNKIQKKDGPLFRGRYKSIVVDAQDYLLSLSRYIHLNPVVAGMVIKPEEYQWSSYKAYIMSDEIPLWLSTQVTLDHLGKKVQRYKYRLFVEEGNDHKTSSFFNRIKMLPVMGGDCFKKEISEKYLSNKKLLPEICAHKELNRKITSEFISKIVLSYYGVSASDLLHSKRSVGNKPRAIAIYLSCKITEDKLSLIANNFAVKNYSAVSQLYYRYNKRLRINKELAEEVHSVEQQILCQFAMSNVKQT